MKSLFQPTIIFAILIFSIQSNAGTLNVNINGIDRVKGKIYLTLCHTKLCFESLSSDAEFFALIVIKVTHKTLNILLPDLPEGEYTAFVFHDRNNNHDFDISLLGKPKEPFGYSNQLSIESEPSFGDAKFYVPESGAVSQKIKLKLNK